MRPTLPVLTLALLALCACGSQSDALDKNLDSSALEHENGLVGTWWHAHEEDADGLEVYRRQGVPLAPARGREGFIVRPDGTFVFLAIAPADGTEERPGQWTREGAVLRATLQDGTVREYRIVSAEPDRLRVQR